MIPLLTLTWLHYLSTSGLSFANLTDLLRLNLFTHRDLRKGLNHPLGAEPIAPLPERLYLPWSGLGKPRPLAEGGSST